MGKIKVDGKRRSDQLDKLISLYDLNDDSKSRLRNLVEKYEHETDEELERKRKVYLSHVVKHTQDEIAEGAKDTSFNRAAYEGLSLVVRGRQRVQSGRESRRFLLQWFGFAGPFLLGIMALPLWNSVFGSGSGPVECRCSCIYPDIAATPE